MTVEEAIEELKKALQILPHGDVYASVNDELKKIIKANVTLGGCIIFEIDD